MALWRLFHKSANVPCIMCGEHLCEAKSGALTYFGDDNGNYSKKCGNCDWVNFWDATGNQSKADKFMAKYDSEIEKRREFSLRQMANKNPLFQEILNKVVKPVEPPKPVNAFAI